MNGLTTSPVKSRQRFHRNAYLFVFSSLQYTQEKLSRTAAHVLNEDEAHISGQELCEGFRELALQKFGLLTKTVLYQWGVRSTEDIGRIVFELIERGEMRKTEHDAPDHFFQVYDFEDAFNSAYVFDTSKAFSDN